MTKEELISRLQDIEWEDFEVCLAEEYWGDSQCICQYFRWMDCSRCASERKIF